MSARRVVRVLVAALALSSGVVAACSSERPGAGGGGGTSSGLPPIVGGVEGGADGGSADAKSEASANACNTTPNKAPSYMITFSSAAEPPPFSGGVIPDGTYFCTSEVRYGEPAGKQPITAPGVTLTIAGAVMKYGAYTTENEYVPMAAQIVRQPADLDAGDDAGARDMVLITQTCPAAGSSLGPQLYSVVGNDFTIGFGSYTVTYTKQ